MTMRLAGRLAALAAMFILAESSPLPAWGAETAAGNVSANDDLAQALALSRTYTELFQKYQSAVVRVNATSNEDGTEQSKFWTGFFINHDGYVLTANARELQNMVRVSVEAENFHSYAEVKGVDLETNVALLHVIFPPKQYAAVDISHPTAMAPIGSMVLAITCKPFQPPGPSSGMVQGYNITYITTALPTMHLRVNIPDDGGEGGSPVFDLQGRFVGMMIARLTELRSSLVLPTQAIDRVAADLLKTGKVAYGRMGIVAEPISDGAAGTRLQITTVEYDGAARAAGLKVDDVLLSIAGNEIHNHDDMRQTAFFARPGQILNIRVRRGSQELDLPLTVSEMPSSAPAGAAGPSQPTTTTSANANGTLTIQAPTTALNTTPNPVPGSVIPVNPEALPPPPPVEVKPK